MPLYEYQCADCGERTEVLQHVNDKPLRICPHCGGELTKLLSAPALQFKGSGFYLTDYGRSGGRKADSSGEKADSAKEAKPATESKPAPAAEKKAS